ncbi:hypothetical protein NIES267_06880 [Calothrix parasitica NIES-267]|uniref:Uncharacterized protein n=1 Tax=Calothrix parasitica NIES-267 TaxID=1973488 RepID=A0A1Z4LJ01_9CYAN|nr:hypothetical protein NIES267_06880 [Calothrix parasitica NIES-267]
MKYKFSSRQSKQLESSLSLTNYVVHLQQHMTDSRFKQDLNYQSQARLELLASRQKF